MSLISRLASFSQTMPSAVSVSLGASSVGYSELFRKVDRLARWLSANCLGSTPVVVIGRDPITVVVSIYATLMCERTCAIVDHRLPFRKVVDVMRKIGASSALLCSYRISSTNDLAKERVSLNTLSEALQLARLSASEFEGEGACADAVSGPALVVFTSGTTGVPKGIALSEGCIERRVEAWSEVLEHSRQDRFLCALPLSHLAGLEIHVFTALHVGASVSFPEGDALDPWILWDLFHRQPVSVLTGTPALYSLLLRSRPLRMPRIQVRHALSHSAPLPQRFAEQIWSELGLRLVNEYGASEVGPTHINLHQAVEHPDAIGRAWPGVQCLKPDGSNFAPGDIDTLHVTSPMLAEGYMDFERGFIPFDRQKAFNLRDVVSCEDSETFRFVGRTDDQLNLSGLKVFPAEVEAVIRGVPGVVDCCVFLPRTDDVTSRLHVAIEAIDAGVAEEAKTACRVDLPSYKCPHVYHIVNELPRTHTGKVSRRLVVDRFS
jgi:acyl-coenzyme A synthetase/AMP-(fatty) acid ligase